MRKMTKTERHKQYASALAEALQAGAQAGTGATPRPMVVGSPKNLVGSLVGGNDGGFDPEQPTYYVADGVCGFAWLQVKGRQFNNWLTGTVASASPASEVLAGYGELVSEPRPDSYYGGVSVWVRGYGQSMQRKEAFAGAVARSLSAANLEGLDTVYSMSRMD